MLGQEEETRFCFALALRRRSASNLFPRTFGQLFFSQGDLVGPDVPSVLVLVDEDEGGGIEDGRWGGGGGRGDVDGRVVRVQEGDVDDVQFFHPYVECLQLPVVPVQRDHLGG